MKKLNLLYSFTFSVLASCSQLGPVYEITPEHVLTDKTVFVDASSTEAVVNGLYKQWRSKGITQMRNAMFCLTQTLRNSSIAKAYEFTINDVSPTSLIVQTYYTDLYYLVNQANTIITGLPGATPKGLNKNRKSEIIGEAYFNRALANFMLLRSFGEFWNIDSKYGVVLYTEPVMDNKGKARSTVKDCYTLITDDLDKAILHAPAYSGISYRATRLAAKALKAKICLYLNDYPQAIDLAVQVITRGSDLGLDLEKYYADIFSNRTQSSELIFSIYTAYPQETIFIGLYNDFYNNGIKGTSITRIADELIGLSDDGNYLTGQGMDPRYSQIYHCEDTDGSKVRMNKYVNNINGEDVNPYYLIRLAEIYLLKAEAEIRSGLYDNARKSLKSTTDRAGYGIDYVEQIANSELLIKIFQHKFMELSGENYEEWFDMVRFNELDGIDFVQLGYIRSYQHKVLPIPYEAMAGNGLLEQNPCYVYKH